MSCPSPDKLKLLVLTGEVEDVEELERHLDECESCRRLLSRFEQLSGEDPGLLASQMEPADRTTPIEEHEKKSLAHEPSKQEWAKVRLLSDAGAEIGGYVLLERVGSGSSGTVFRALQPHTERVVAFKLLNRSRRDVEGFKAWKREARLVGRVKHPHVVQIVNAGESEDREYCVFEWIEGGSLADRLQQSQLDFREAAELARQIADGCAALHERNILHRDIKPSNVLLDADGRAKLADFGVARSLDETITTATGAMIGTPGYMSPEQLGTIHFDIDNRTDVYGIGAVLYAMLLGHGPFAGSSAVEIVANAAKHDILPPSSQRSVPKDLETICLKCLRRDPKERYSNAKAVAEDLSRFLRSEPILARRPTLLRRIQHAAKKHKLATTAITLALMVGILFIGMASYINYREARSQAAMRLQQVLRCKPTELSTALSEFQNSGASAIAAALSDAEVQSATLPAVQQLRLALASGAGPSSLVQLVVDHAEAIGAEEFPPLFEFLQDHNAILPASVAEQCRVDVATSQEERRLKLLATLASAAPEEFGHAESACVIHGLKDTRSADANVWIRGLLPVAEKQLSGLVRLLAMEDFADQTRAELVQFGWDLLKLRQAGEVSLAEEELSVSLSQLLLYASTQQISTLVHELPNGSDTKGIVDQLNNFANPVLDGFDPVKSTLPEALEPLKAAIDKYDGFYCENVVLLPAVPLAEWPQLDDLRESLRLEVIGFRPAVVDGELLAAVTLLAGDSKPTQLSIDVREAKVAKLAKRYANDGWYPISIWAREESPSPPAPLSSRPLRGEERGESSQTKLLVSVVWQQTVYPQEIRFDETLEDWGMPKTLHQENYYAANQYTTLRLGFAEDVEGTEEVANRLYSEPLRIYPTYKYQRSVSIVRDRSAWNLSEASKEPFRIQETVGDFFEHAQLKAIERNFAFTDRVRKLCPGAYPVAEFQSIAQYLASVSFAPEYVSIAEGADGELLVGSRWSAAFDEYDEDAEQMASHAIFAALLLGDPSMAIRSFDQRLDRTLGAQLMSFGEFLDQRSTSAVVRLIEAAESDWVKYSIGIMLGYAPRERLDARIVERLNKWRTVSRHAGVLGSLNWLENEISTKIDLRNETNPKQDTNSKHGDLLRSVNSHDLVVLDFRGQPLLTGSERIGAIDGYSSQNVDMLNYKFAVGTHEVTRGQFRKFVEATAACEMPAATMDATTDNFPVSGIEYHHMLQYCRWLSEQAGLKGNIGLPEIAEIGYNADFAGNLVQSIGFRLPTHQELGQAGRAYTTGDRFFGRNPLLQDYANVSSNMETDLKPVGSLRPNPFGLFDCYGSVLDACLLRRHGQSRVIPERERKVRTSTELIGGSFLTATRYATAGGILTNTEDRIKDIHVGFRIARTLE